MAILDGLKERLASDKQPKRVVFVDDLPRNFMGKVQKNAPRDRSAEPYQLDPKLYYLDVWL